MARKAPSKRPGPAPADQASGREAELVEIDLRNPWLALFLAWLWPGAGHLYQRRVAKGLLFMICILGLYFFGLVMGGGHVVYASWQPAHRRYPYLCQFWVGLPALPALVQNRLVRAHPDAQPLLGGWMAPPRHFHPKQRDELARWYERYGILFDMGTLYTMIAGLLNILAMYDAFGGPVGSAEEEEDSAGRGPPEAKGAS